MTGRWEGVNRADRGIGSSAWERLRRQVFRRDRHRCQVAFPLTCTRVAEEVDHINGIKTDHRLENLRAVCKDCHKRLTQQQAAAGRARNAPARAAKREEIRNRFRRTEDHPGLIASGEASAITPDDKPPF